MAETIRINTEEYNEEFSRKLKVLVIAFLLLGVKFTPLVTLLIKLWPEALARGGKITNDRLD